MGMKQGLNAAQAEAIDVENGPLLILAGAGSGKTKTLTHRIAHLISTQKVWPDEILAVTFTNKAAKEMRQRLSELIAQPNSRQFMAWMGTFHGICVRMLKIDGSKIGILNNFVIYDEADRLGLIKQAMKQIGINDKQIKPKAVSSTISNAKNDMISPLEFSENAQYPAAQEIAKIYSLYEQLKQKAGALDFDDLLLETVHLLRDSTQTRSKWRSHFKHIFIDEYQDTNAAQYAIVKYLVNDDKNICVVGDDWQSIYSWRGADFTNILNFERDCPGAKVIKLEQNYRSTGSILDAAHLVISKNSKRTDKKLWTDAGKGLPVEVHPTYDESEEAYSVASRIGTQTSLGARNYGDFAVLYRMNSQSYALERALLQQRIPYQIIGGVRFFDRKEIKDVIAYLRLIYQPADIMSFSRIVNLPARGIGATSLEKFLIWQNHSGMDIIGALSNVDQSNGLTPRARAALARLGEILRSLQAMVISEAAPTEIIESLLERTGYREFLLDGTPQAEERESNIGALVSDARNFVSLSDYLAEVALMSSADSSGSNEKVTLMTLHASKGLEFKVVFMVGMEEGIFPHSRVFDSGPSELEEERRLCYVGMTRARDELHLSYASSRLQFGQRDYNMPSRFLTDMGHLVANVPLDISAKNTNDQDFDDFMDIPDFSSGDRVRSLQFGDGEVIDVDGMAVEVKFDNGSQKKLNVEYARLEKITE